VLFRSQRHSTPVKRGIESTRQLCSSISQTSLVKRGIESCLSPCYQRHSTPVKSGIESTLAISQLCSSIRPCEKGNNANCVIRQCHVLYAEQLIQSICLNHQSLLDSWLLIFKFSQSLKCLFHLMYTTKYN